jgi:sodium-dependent dicarboxylate transporter 2/3/5
MKPSTPKDHKFGMIAGGLIGFAALATFLDLSPGHPAVSLTAAVALLMAFLWITEALPIGVTSLLPLVLFPALGVMDGKAVSDAYVNYVIFLFIGGFLMALALERWGLHKRMALRILMALGGSPRRILAGFMLASAFLSMWISNTATAMMMLPIVHSVSGVLQGAQVQERGLGKFSTALLLGVAYSCSIGGIATLVGTPPNLSFVRLFSILYPQAPEISFGDWLLFALPLSVAMLAAVWLLLYALFPAPAGMKALPTSYFRSQYQALGKASPAQRRVLVLFLALVFLWIFRKELAVGAFVIPGWGGLLPSPAFANDGTVAIFIGLLLFCIPASPQPAPDGSREALADWNMVKQMPWDIVWLFGGGFALAKGFIDSGLSAYIGEALSHAGNLGHGGLLVTVTASMTFLTEFTSNTATTEMMLPVMAGLAQELQIHPLFLMLPITLAASMAFMFPVATPPNAVVFGSGNLHIADMAKAGIWVNLVGIVLVVLLVYFWGGALFDIDPAAFPEWAQKPAAGQAP